MEDLQASVREFSELDRKVFDAWKELLSVSYHSIDPDLVELPLATGHDRIGRRRRRRLLVRQEHLPRTGDLVSLLTTRSGRAPDGTAGVRHGICLGCWWKWDTGVHVVLLQHPSGVMAVPFQDIVDIRILATIGDDGRGIMAKKDDD